MEIQPNEVNSRLSFVTFVQSLRNDLNNDGMPWENMTLRDFLAAMESYTEDIQGYYDNLNLKIDANVPSWRVFADILKGATMYE